MFRRICVFQSAGEAGMAPTASFSVTVIMLLPATPCLVNVYARQVGWAQTVS